MVIIQSAVISLLIYPDVFDPNWSEIHLLLLSILILCELPDRTSFLVPNSGHFDGGVGDHRLFYIEFLSDGNS